VPPQACQAAGRAWSAGYRKERGGGGKIHKRGWMEKEKKCELDRIVVVAKRWTLI
jgi:hypothetical protein